MKKIINTLFVMSILCSCMCQAQTTDKPATHFTALDKIIAVVNNEVITQSQLNKEIEHIKKQFQASNQPLPPNGELRAKVLDSLIGKSLTLQLAQKKGITVSDDDINNAISNITKANKIDVTQLKQALQQQGMTFEVYKKQLKDQIAMQKVQQEEVAKTITVTPEDVKKFVRENKDKLNSHNAFHVVDILMPIAENANNNQVDSLRKQSAEVVVLLQKQKSIDEVLQKYPYAQKNDLGWRAIGELPSLFQSKVAAMSVKSVSAPIQAPNGFHILQLVEAKGENPKLSDADLKNLAFQQKVHNGIQEWTNKLRSESFVKVMH